MTRPTILIVDDQKANRHMLSLRLSKEGYQVVTAESGREALKLVSEGQVSLVLLDLMMPEMSGIEVLQEIRKKRGPTQLPVLMLSANSDSPQMAAAIDLGANDYLTKPIDFQVLMAKLRLHLQLRVRSTPPAQQAAVGGMLGHYHLGQLIGSGGMGQVFRAFDTRLLREVAIKVMVDPGPGGAARFVQEARAVARVSHPGVVTIHEIEPGPPAYIAMELLEGHLLRDLIAEGPMPVGRAVNLMRQVLQAMAVVHEAGVTHRDLNPANIMVGPDDRVKVMDFGLAKLSDQVSTVTQAGQVWGTPQYMAPEQIDPRIGPIDGQTDLFAAAGILYEMITGRAPFNSATIPILIFEILSQDPVPPAQLLPELGESLSAAVLNGLRKSKEMRYRDCADFLEALQGF